MGGHSFYTTVFSVWGLPIPLQEYRFDDVRRWRFDYAWPEYRLALEVEGGIWVAGRHVRPGGMLADIEKYNSATIQGWRVIRCTPGQLESGDIVPTLRQALHEPSPE